jgi:cholesterol oxidase
VGWPEEITYEGLKPHYDAVKTFMNVREVPDNQWTSRMRLVQEAAEAAGLGRKFRKLEVAVTFDDAWTYDDFSKGKAASKKIVNAQGAEQGTCVHLGDCDVGCEVRAKNTLDLNYLYWAEKKGAEIRPLHLVTNIEPVAAGYRVHYDRIENERRIPGSETAGKVIIAAGSIGSTELLLRCKYQTKSLPDVSDMLGRGWSSNGDFLTPAVYAHRAIEPSRGPTIAAAIDLYDDVTGEGSYWVQDGGIPNLAAGLVEDMAENPRLGFEAKRLLEFVQHALVKHGPLSNVMPWFAQGVDAGNGVLSLKQRSLSDHRQRLDLEWDISKSRRVIDDIIAMHKRLAHVTGGVALVPPTWSIFKNLITPHPLGGCNMGQDREHGVVNHAGEVFQYPGLYVTDGAIVPVALGVNPSRTIGALSERVASLIAARG